MQKRWLQRVHIHLYEETESIYDLADKKKVENEEIEIEELLEKEYQTKNVTKIFRATIFGLRNNTIEDMPAGWDIKDIEDLDWFCELVKKPIDILDNF